MDIFLLHCFYFFDNFEFGATINLSVALLFTFGLILELCVFLRLSMLQSLSFFGGGAVCVKNIKSDDKKKRDGKAFLSKNYKIFNIQILSCLKTRTIRYAKYCINRFRHISLALFLILFKFWIWCYNNLRDALLFIFGLILEIVVFCGRL